MAEELHLRGVAAFGFCLEAGEFHNRRIYTNVGGTFSEWRTGGRAGEENRTLIQMYRANLNLACLFSVYVYILLGEKQEVQVPDLGLRVWIPGVGTDLGCSIKELWRLGSDFHALKLPGSQDVGI